MNEEEEEAEKNAQEELEKQAEDAREDLAETTEFVMDNRLNMDRTPISNISTLRNGQDDASDIYLPLQLVHSAYQV